MDSYPELATLEGKSIALQTAESAQDFRRQLQGSLANCTVRENGPHKTVLIQTLAAIQESPELSSLHTSWLQIWGFPWLPSDLMIC